jgi:signal peptidase I
VLLAAITSACTDSGTFTVVMQDRSMEATLAARAEVHFERASTAQRGEIVAFEYPFAYPGRPRRELIARVIGLAGDTLELGSEGVVVNGRRLDEPYARNQQDVSAARLVVPPDTYYVLGDDRNNQRDSRWWGPLPAAKLRGVASNPALALPTSLARAHRKNVPGLAP